MTCKNPGTGIPRLTANQIHVCGIPMGEHRFVWTGGIGASMRRCIVVLGRCFCGIEETRWVLALSSLFCCLVFEFLDYYRVRAWVCIYVGFYTAFRQSTITLVAVSASFVNKGVCFAYVGDKQWITYFTILYYCNTLLSRDRGGRECDAFHLDALSWPLATNFWQGSLTLNNSIPSNVLTTCIQRRPGLFASSSQSQTWKPMGAPIGTDLFLAQRNDIRIPWVLTDLALLLSWLLS